MLTNQYFVIWRQSIYRLSIYRLSTFIAFFLVYFCLWFFHHKLRSDPRSDFHTALNLGIFALPATEDRHRLSNQAKEFQARFIAAPSPYSVSISTNWESTGLSLTESFLATFLCLSVNSI